MIKNNLLGQILIGLLIFFLLLSSIQMFGWGQRLSEVTLDSEDQLSIPEVLSTDQQVEIKKDDKELMDSIISRPMFSDTRTPFVAPIVDPTPPEEVAEINDLNVQLTGVVITPDGSYAMILDGATKKRETYKVGMPLNGEQGGWTLNSIQSRKVVFVSDDDKTAELELEVFTGSLKSGDASRKNTKDANPLTVNKDTNADKADKKKNADDIRRKIAERRAQMRADAANKNNNK